MNCQDSMNCRRCGRTMIYRKFLDYGGHSWGWECIFCKEIVDHVPEIHRPPTEDWSERHRSVKEGG